MTRTRPRLVELENLDDFLDHVARHGSLAHTVTRDLDLTGYSVLLGAVVLERAVFLGCVFDPDTLRRVHEARALVFPRFEDLPFRAFRSTLYRPVELFSGYVAGDGGSLAEAFDPRVYDWYRAAVSRNDVVDALAQRVHDHSIDDALEELLSTNGLAGRVVAIMGGHALARDEPAYRDVAVLARALTRSGMFCASGGGPGAMEATNLGAFFSKRSLAELNEALAVLAVAPLHDPIPAWLDSALEVRRRWPVDEARIVSLGVPTWHYGHEPPNVFASHIAKYFANSIREDGLLAIALAGVVFAPGSAGTIQEVFQDAAQNHYETFGMVSPMVFMGTRYWTEVKPVYPLLKTLSADRAYGEAVGIGDSVEEILAALGVVVAAPED